MAISRIDNETRVVRQKLIIDIVMVGADKRF